MTQLFISYSRADRSFVDEFVRFLRRVYGMENVWFDNEIYGGTDWWEMILSRIAACDVFIYLLSNESIRSTYCQAECREALRLHKPTLPIVIEPQTALETLPDDLQELVSRIQYVELYEGPQDSEAMNEVYAALMRLLNEVPDEPPAPRATYPVGEPSVGDQQVLAKQLAKASAEAKPGVIVGVVSRFEQSIGGSRRSFWLQRDQAGEALPPVPVEMRGYPFSGSIANGDIVEVKARRWRPGRVVKVKRAYNHTLDIPVRAGNTVGNILASPFLIIVIIIIVVLVAIAMSGGG